MITTFGHGCNSTKFVQTTALYTYMKIQGETFVTNKCISFE